MEDGPDFQCFGNIKFYFLKGEKVDKMLNQNVQKECGKTASGKVVKVLKKC